MQSQSWLALCTQQKLIDIPEIRKVESFSAQSINAGTKDKQISYAREKLSPSCTYEQEANHLPIISRGFYRTTAKQGLCKWCKQSTSESSLRFLQQGSVEQTEHQWVSHPRTKVTGNAITTLKARDACVTVGWSQELPGEAPWRPQWWEHLTDNPDDSLSWLDYCEFGKPRGPCHRGYVIVWYQLGI